MTRGESGGLPSPPCRTFTGCTGTSSPGALRLGLRSRDAGRRRPSAAARPRSALGTRLARRRSRPALSGPGGPGGPEVAGKRHGAGGRVPSCRPHATPTRGGPRWPPRRRRRPSPPSGRPAPAGRRAVPHRHGDGAWSAFHAIPTSSDEDRHRADPEQGDRHPSLIAAGAIRLDGSHHPDDAPPPFGPGGCLRLASSRRHPPNHTPSAVPGHPVTRPRTVNPRGRGSSASLRPPGR